MIIKGAEVALPSEYGLKKIDIRINKEIISELGTNLSGEQEIIDAKDMIVLPGCIDAHVHFNDPGYTEKEDFTTGTSAAIAGGVTFVLDMPCTSNPAITNKDALTKKINTVKNKAVCDYGFFGGISDQCFTGGTFQKDMDELAPYVLGFKTYFTSGMDTFARVNHYQFCEILNNAKKLGKVVLLHAEDYDFVIPATEVEKTKGNSATNFYNSRPEIAEITAIAAAAYIAEETGADLHIVHLGSAHALKFINNKNITAETAPHYLEFSAEDFFDQGSMLKISPPLKSRWNKDFLWLALHEGTISYVASDHAPCSLNNKNTGSTWTDYSGIAGVQTILPYMYSEGYCKGRLTLKRFIETISFGPAKRFGIHKKKGSIEVGKDADLVIIDPKQNWTVSEKDLISKGKNNPFIGRTFQGRIVATILRGQTAYSQAKGISIKTGYGKLF